MAASMVHAVRANRSRKLFEIARKCITSAEISRRNLSAVSTHYLHNLQQRKNVPLTSLSSIIDSSSHFRYYSGPTAEQPDKEQPASKADEQKTEGEEISETEKKLTEENKKLLEKLTEMEDKYKRSLAETENVRLRMKKQVDDSKLFAIQGFCKDLLDVADVLQKATESVPKEELEKGSQHLQGLYDGLVMTEKELQRVFTRNGLVKLDPVDEKFDPNFHEAIFYQPFPDKTPGHVAVVTKVGYKLHNRTVRPAIVGVVKEG